MIYVTRKEHFNAAHRVWRKDWSDEQNEAVFGRCANKNWHGHNFELYVTVKGHINPETGFVADLKRMSQVIKKEIIEELDHKNLNTDVPFMQGKMASIETLITEIWKKLKSPIETLGCELHSLKLYETENNYVEYYG